MPSLPTKPLCNPWWENAFKFSGQAKKIVSPAATTTTTSIFLRIFSRLSLSQVLVNNPSTLLPLNTSTRIAVVGPSANVTDLFLGDYRPAACPNTTEPAPQSTQCLQTIYQAMQAKLGPQLVGFAAGCSDGPTCQQLDLAPVHQAVAQADVIVAVVGTKTTDNCVFGNTNMEGTDRTTIGLPGLQQNITDLLLATGKPLVYIVVSDGQWSYWGKNERSWVYLKINSQTHV